MGATAITIDRHDRLKLHKDESPFFAAQPMGFGQSASLLEGKDVVAHGLAALLA